MTEENRNGIIEALRAGRANIERGYCKGSYAIDAAGNPCAAFISHAVARCAVGALLGTHADCLEHTRAILEFALEDLHGESNLLAWNDRPETTKEDVLALYDRAIELATTVQEVQD